MALVQRYFDLPTSEVPTPDIGTVYDKSGFKTSPLGGTDIDYQFVTQTGVINTRYFGIPNKGHRNCRRLLQQSRAFAVPARPTSET